MPTLRLALRNYADFENGLSEEARLFEEAHPEVRVELVSVGIHDLHRIALADGGLRDGSVDLALLVTDWLDEGVAGGALEDLNPWHEREPLPDWPSGWAPSLVQPLIIDGRLSSIPWHDGPECLVYRSDLFAETKHREAFRALAGRELDLPKTWEEFAEIACFFTGREPGLYGTVFAAFPDGHNTLYDFALQVWSRGGELLRSDGTLNLNSPRAHAGLEYYRNLVCDRTACHPRSPGLDSTQSGDIFLQGEAAMMVNWFGFAARACLPGSPLEGKVAIGPIPTDGIHPPVSLSVFWTLAIGAGSKQKGLAWDFLRFVARPDRDLGITKHGPVAVRLSSWRSQELQAQIPVYSEIEGISLGARRLPRGPDMAEFAAIVDSIVTRALSTPEPTAIILESAQRESVSKGLKFV